MLCANIMFTQKQTKKILHYLHKKQFGEIKQWLKYEHAFFCSNVSRSNGVLRRSHTYTEGLAGLFPYKPCTCVRDTEASAAAAGAWEDDHREHSCSSHHRE